MKAWRITLTEKISRNAELILILLLLLFYATESINKFSIYLTGEKNELQSMTKGVVMILALFSLILKKSKNLIFLLGLTIIFLIGQWGLPDGFSFITLNYFLKYLFPIALFGIFYLQPNKPKYRLLQFYEYLLALNSILILAGWLFEIRYFQTYRGPRSGFNGLLVSSSTGTYFYVIGLCYFLIRYQKALLKNWKFWLLALTGLVIGTKSAILALTAIGLFYIIQYIGSRNFKLGLLGLFAIGALGFAYYLFFMDPIFLKLKETQGFATSFLSLRDQLFMEYTLPYIQEQWNFLNYLFGGVENFDFRPQMELLDLLFFWGIIGSFFYLLYYFKSYFNFNYQKPTFLFSFGLLIVVSLLAGNFLYNASLPIYLIILREGYAISFPDAVDSNPLSKIFAKNFE